MKLTIEWYELKLITRKQAENGDLKYEEHLSIVADGVTENICLRHCSQTN